MKDWVPAGEWFCEQSGMYLCIGYAYSAGLTRTMSVNDCRNALSPVAPLLTSTSAYIYIYIYIYICVCVRMDG